MLQMFRVKVMISWLLVGVTAPGCSMMFVSGPPDGYEQMDSFDCSTNKFWVGFDWLQSAGNALYGVTSAVTSTDANGNEVPAEQRTLGVALGLGFAIVHAVSANAGNKRVNECRKAKADHHYNSQMRIMHQEAAAAAPDLPDLPDRISKQDVVNTVRPLEGKVIECGMHHLANGVLKVRIEVQPNGRVASTKIARAEPRLSLCIRGVFHNVQFPAARRGRVFTYPFTLTPHASPGASGPQGEPAPAPSPAP